MSNPLTVLADKLFCAVRTYSTKQHDEISVPIGSVVEVLRQSDDGWWLSRYAEPSVSPVSLSVNGAGPPLRENFL